jgi:hypothetical protein
LAEKNRGSLRSRHSYTSSTVRPVSPRATATSIDLHYGSETQLTLESEFVAAVSVHYKSVKEEELLQHQRSKQLKEHNNSSASSSFERAIIREDSCEAHALQVPKIVATCIEYLLKYGMSQDGSSRTVFRHLDGRSVPSWWLR